MYWQLIVRYLIRRRSRNDDNSAQLIDNFAKLIDNLWQLIDNDIEMIDNLCQLIDKFLMGLVAIW
ncbi:hypothetical protein [Sporosarcina sp. YIM B06819]|uniref:hypothetical protein n=1 Tax=Sporosarcina sp. YIM B06819 TaxID=3081769 RepID=UPI00298C49FF|nr:hypothetical protein [Sporosarcina sp. YIM B06819]